MSKPIPPDCQRPAIEFFTTRELIDELMSRNIATLLCQIPKNHPERASIVVDGGRFTALGLAQQAVFDMLNNRLEKSDEK